LTVYHDSNPTLVISPCWRGPGRAEPGPARLYGDLADAVRHESAQAVQFWWGVGSDRVWKWRKALDAKRVNEGTHRLMHDYALEPALTAGRKKAWKKQVLQPISQVPPERLRHFRAVEALERINTLQARKLLRELALGAPAATLTLEATGAYRRLERDQPSPRTRPQ
jgi:hypothetical protein